MRLWLRQFSQWLGRGRLVMRKFALLSAMVFAFAAPASARDIQPANDEPGGGQGFYRVCDPVTHIQWEYSYGWWKPVGQC